ncbi:hypothetical protein KUTeg_009287 [Tegillarca granosa]|uniref:Chromo domain-containing protein n=1 Tax=Tegillarca granosa TaxID=220873 RepID=A0ABQ9F708_TEGGR|nr:hypothetical protein KUTeg_009287 [Tegillarca granosa]
MVLVPYDRYQRLTALKPGVKHTQEDVKRLNVQPEVIIPESEPEMKILAEDRPNIEDILVAVPVNIRNKARALLNHLRKHLKWNERGEISVDGRIIPGSNIVDLIKVSVKEYKDFEPVGLESFSKVIYDSNAPLSLIAPSKRQIGSGLPPPPGIPSKRNDESKKTPNRRIYKFKVGDVVRISFLKRTFQKEYDERWSRELFVVTERFVREGIPQYKLKDYANDVIDGTFYQNQLNKAYEQEVYFIDKVLKTRGKGKNKAYLIRWKGWGPKYDFWIGGDAFKSIKGSDDTTASA